MKKRKIQIYARALAGIGLLGVGIGVFSHLASNSKTQEVITEQEFFIPTYDVIVVGTDPEGISAAVSSARNGLNTLLIDTRDRVGGLFTLGGLNSLDMNYYKRPSGYSTLLTQGIFEEFMDDMGSRRSWLTGVYKRDSFDVEQVEAIFDAMIADEENITLQMGLEDITPILEDHAVVGVEIIHDERVYQVYSEVCIDATQDASIASESGVPYVVGGAMINKPDQMQAITQVFKVENIDWDTLRKAVNADEDFYEARHSDYSVWGFGPQLKEYEPISDRVKVRGPNIGIQNDGTALINAMQIVGYNPLEEGAIEEVTEIAVQEAKNIVEFMRQTIPGFEQAVYGGVTEELYVRESIHIEGEYTLTIEDVMKYTDFEDKIAWGSYPIDIQTSDMNNTGFVLGNPEAYSIPFRSIVPKEIDNLLVVGRSASYDPVAFGSVRVVPIGMAVAEGAGVAAAYAIEHDQSFREIAYDDEAIDHIQERLKEQGAYLEDLDIPYVHEGYASEEAIDFFYSLGVINAGYYNDLQLEDSVSEALFYNLLTSMIDRTQVEFPNTEYVYKVGTEPMTIPDIIDILWQVLGQDVAVTQEYKVNALKSHNVFSQEVMDILVGNEYLTREDLYVLLHEFYQYNEANDVAELLF